MRVKGEATRISDGLLALLKTPEALIEECRDQRKLLGLAYQSDCRQWLAASASGTRISGLVAGAAGAPPASNGHVPLAHCRTTRHRVPAPSPSALSLVYQLSIGFFYTFKSEPYCLLKPRWFLIRILNVLVWINNAVASKVPAGKGKQWLQQSASCTKPGLCVETWHLLFICLLSSWAGIRQLHVLGL